MLWVVTMWWMLNTKGKGKHYKASYGHFEANSHHTGKWGQMATDTLLGFVGTVCYLCWCLLELISKNIKCSYLPGLNFWEMACCYLVIVCICWHLSVQFYHCIIVISVSWNISMKCSMLHCKKICSVFSKKLAAVLTRIFRKNMIESNSQ